MLPGNVVDFSYFSAIDRFHKRYSLLSDFGLSWAMSRQVMTAGNCHAFIIMWGNTDYNNLLRESDAAIRRAVELQHHRRQIGVFTLHGKRTEKLPVQEGIIDESKEIHCKQRIILGRVLPPGWRTIPLWMLAASGDTGGIQLQNTRLHGWILQQANPFAPVGGNYPQRR